MTPLFALMSFSVQQPVIYYYSSKVGFILNVRLSEPESMTSEFPDDAFEHEVQRESLVIIYRQTPASAIAHIIAAGLGVLALSPVVPTQSLLLWWLVLSFFALCRLIVAVRFIKKWPIDNKVLPKWVRAQEALAICQTSVWGLSVFTIWPDIVEYQMFMIVLLFGIISVGGIVLSTHRRSFILYCFPIAIPLMAHLVLQNQRVDWIIAILVVLYIGVAFSAITRLELASFKGLKLRHQMQALSRTDPLTELANRREFDEQLNEAWQKAIRAPQALGLIMADVDHFKAYNDKYGHPVGDDALKRVAQSFRTVASRGTDLCARIGGEEFAIIMPSTDLEGSLRIAKEIQQAIHAADIDHGGSPLDKLTVSMGVTSLTPTKELTLQTFVENTDKALYRAKNNGRDRIESG